MNILNIYVLFFGALREARLFANLEKCTFCTDRVAFLGYVVTPQGIEVDEAKIEAIKAGQFLQLSHNFRVFLALQDFFSIL
jgi:hypothetical protein